MPENESKSERLDRELGELLQGLRVLLPGVQVLFAFLLTVPFSQRFPRLSRPEQGLYLAALVCAAMASAFLIAPSAFHRILFRERDKEWLIVASNGLTIVGTIFLAIAITCSAYLVTEVIYGSRLAAAIAAGLGIVFFGLWYAVPVARRATRRRA